MTRGVDAGLIRLAMLGIVLAAPTALPAAEAGPGVRLRQAWIEHRLRGHFESAEAGYRAVVADASADADLRARARLGLALLARDRGDLAAAREETARVLSLGRAAPRWRRAARLLRAELEGTAVTSANPESGLLEELQERVTSLQGDLERVRETAADREEELERKDRMLRRLEEREREAVASGDAGARRFEAERHRASRWLEELVRDDRQQQRLQRSLIRSHLLTGRQAFRAGRFHEALNEMKKILILDPLHREALDLSSRCRTLLAATAGVDAFEPPEPGRMGVTPPDLIEELTLAAMRAWLAEARRHQAQGRTLEAIQSASKVLEEYSWSPAPLPEAIVAELVGGADRVLEECTGLTVGSEESAEARALRERQLELIGSLRERFSQLMATELALAEADESAERLADPDATEVPLELVREFEATMSAAARALAAELPSEAIRHYRDLLVLLEWAPELDADGTIRPELVRQLATLEGSGALLPGGEKGLENDPAEGEKETPPSTGSRPADRGPGGSGPGDRGSGPGRGS